MATSLSLSALTLAAFVEDVEALLAREERPHIITEGIRQWLPRLLANPDFLAPQYREPDPARYHTSVIALAPSKRFSVVAMVWLPGQMTAIHDHVTWCVVGVLEGLEREERFELRERDGERWLRPDGEDAVAAGETCALVPPEENIHRVRNAGATTAISIHVYGADITRLGTSINECFDDLPIRPGDVSGTSVAWRRVRG